MKDPYPGLEIQLHSSKGDNAPLGITTLPNGNYSLKSIWVTGGTILPRDHSQSLIMFLCQQQDLTDPVTARRTIECLTADLDAVENRLAASEETVSEVRARNAELLRFAQMPLPVKALQDKVDATERENERLRQEVHNLTVHRDDLLKANASWKEQRDSIKASNIVLATDLQNTQSQLDAFLRGAAKPTVRHLEDEIQQLKEGNRRAVMAAEEATKTNCALATSRLEIQNLLDEAKAKLLSYEKVNVTLKEKYLAADEAAFYWEAKFNTLINSMDEVTHLVTGEDLTIWLHRNLQPVEKAIACLSEVLTKKNADYAVQQDPFSNFREAAAQINQPPAAACEVLIGVKQSRLKALDVNGRDPQNESILDTILDRAGYSIIALAMALEASTDATIEDIIS